MRPNSRQARDTPSHPRWSAIPLDSVRRTGHQQFGRIENVRGVVFYSVLVRQHKDDFKVVFHGVVIIMLCFRDYDGALQVETRCSDLLCGFVHGLLRRAAVLPVQYVTGSCPHVDDNLCERVSGRVGKDWLRHVHCRVRRSMWSVIPHLLENGHCQALPNQASPAFSVPRYLVTLVVEPCACKLECAVSPECKSNPNPQTSFQCPLWAKPATCRRSDSAASATHRQA